MRNGGVFLPTLTWCYNFLSYPRSHDVVQVKVNTSFSPSVRPCPSCSLSCSVGRCLFIANFNVCDNFLELITAIRFNRACHHHCNCLWVTGGHLHELRRQAISRLAAPSNFSVCPAAVDNDRYRWHEWCGLLLRKRRMCGNCNASAVWLAISTQIQDVT